MSPKLKTVSCRRPTTSWLRFTNWRATERAARGLLLAAVLAALPPGAAFGGTTIYSIDERELAERQSYATEAAHFSTDLVEGQEQSLQLQFWLGEEGGGSDVPGVGTGFTYDRRIIGPWSAGLSAGITDSHMGSWWMGAQGAYHFEGPGRLRITPQLSVGLQDAGGGFELFCQGRLGTSRSRPVSSLRYTHLYEHVLFSMPTGRFEWLVDLGYMTTFSHLDEAPLDFFGNTPECASDPVDSVGQFTLAAGLGASIGALRLVAGVRGGSMSLHVGMKR